MKERFTTLNPAVPPTQFFVIRPIGRVKMPSIIQHSVCLMQWNEWCVTSEEQASVNLVVWSWIMFLKPQFPHLSRVTRPIKVGKWSSNFQLTAKTKDSPSFQSELIMGLWKLNCPNTSLFCRDLRALNSELFTVKFQLAHSKPQLTLPDRVILWYTASFE